LDELARRDSRGTRFCTSPLPSWSWERGGAEIGNKLASVLNSSLSSTLSPVVLP